MDLVQGQGWQDARNILCVRLDTLGDVLMTTPAIRALKTFGGGAGRRITLMTSPAGAEVANLVPEIDSVLVYEAPWMKATGPRPGSHLDQALIERLRAEGFDAAVIFTVYSQNPLPAVTICYLADIPLRLAHCHENPYQLLTNWVPDPEPAQYVRHEVQRQLGLVASIGCRPAEAKLSLAVPAAARARMVQRLDALGLSDNRRWVLVHPGASAASRRYPPESFAAVVHELVVNHELPVLFSGGGASERELVQAIQAGSGAPTHSLAGELDLGELAALIEAAPVLLANNTGPVHMAAALGTPVVDLYALTNPQHTPWAVPSRVLYHDVPCKFCYKSVCPEGHHNCLRLVEPETVTDAVIDLLQKAGGWRRDGLVGPGIESLASTPSPIEDEMSGVDMASEALWALGMPGLQRQSAGTNVRPV
jgi:lipopolysaccharide heptosyltransferase II